MAGRLGLDGDWQNDARFRRQAWNSYRKSLASDAEPASMAKTDETGTDHGGGIQTRHRRHRHAKRLFAEREHLLSRGLAFGSSGFTDRTIARFSAPGLTRTRTLPYGAWLGVDLCCAGRGRAGSPTEELVE